MDWLERAWMLQYLACFFTWGAVAAVSIYKLSAHPNRFSVLCLWSALWYLSIQIHWMLNEADKHPGYTELWWSGFETMVGLLLVQSLLGRRTIERS